MKNIPIYSRQIRVRGIPINIAPPAECDQADWWICVRVSDGPGLARSEIAKCTICAQDIWFDPAMGITRPPKICMHCMGAKIRNAEKIELAATPPHPLTKPGKFV